MRKFKRTTYATEGNLAVMALYDEYGYPELDAVTVNLGVKLPENQAYIDINNAPNAIKEIEEAGIGTFAGKRLQSGFVTYPLYEFDLDKIEVM